MKLAEDCLRKYQYKMIEGWQPRRKSVHLLFGGWYATALEHYHKHIALGDKKDEALIKVVREALVSTWIYKPCPVCKGRGQVEATPEQFALAKKSEPGLDWLMYDCLTCSFTGIEHDDNDKPVGSPWQSDHTSKTRENLIRTIIWYVDHFEDDPVTVFKRPDGTPAVEYSFSFEAADASEDTPDGIVFSGHIDRLVEYSGSYYVMDQKTTGSTITPQFFDQFDPDSQMSLYTMAGKIIYDKPVRGVIIDAAQIAVGFSRFLRGFTFRDDAKINEWYDSAFYHIRAARQATHEGKFPMNPSSCGKYLGCEFRNVCSKSPHVREQFLIADFEKGETWNPLARR